jgi:hypothetical protein
MHPPEPSFFNKVLDRFFIGSLALQDFLDGIAPHETDDGRCLMAPPENITTGQRPSGL